MMSKFFTLADKFVLLAGDQLAVISNKFFPVLKIQFVKSLLADLALSQNVDYLTKGSTGDEWRRAHCAPVLSGNM